MNRTKSIIIDDERANRELLQQLLERHCPTISVCGCAASVDEGFGLIAEYRPDIVFLDVRMPEENGFDLLRRFKKPDFIVIFVTAYDEYAINAFDYNAIDYILKPIDYAKLIRSVERATEQIALKVPGAPAISEKPVREAAEPKSLPFHLNDKVTFVNIDQICYIRGMSNYCEVITASGQRLLSSRTLAYYEEHLPANRQFLRINKGFLINIRFILSYTKGRSCFIEMKNNDYELEVSRRKKQHILQFLRSSGQDIAMR